MMQKQAFFGLIASLSLVAASAYAVSVTETFENLSSGSTVKDIATQNAAWGGCGSVSIQDTPVSCNTGMPTSGDHSKVLSVDGYVVCANSTAMSGNPVVDMMVQVALPEDALELPVSEQGEPIQIAVGVDRDGALKLYSNGKGGTPGWSSLKSGLTEGSWVRVSMFFDYAAKRCQVRVNGEPVMTDAGYLTATTEDGTKAGAWYALADGNKTTLGNVKVVGSTAIDEIVLSNESTYEYPLVEAQDDGSVPRAWFNKHGITWDETVAYDNSGLTVRQKYLAGLSPMDGERFELKDMAMAGQSVTLTFPRIDPPAGRSIAIEVASSPDFAGTVTTKPIEKGATSATISLPAEGNVFYYRLRSTSAQ